MAVSEKGRRFWEEERVCAKAKGEGKNAGEAGRVSKDQLMKVLESLLC